MLSSLSSHAPPGIFQRFGELSDAESWRRRVQGASAAGVSKTRVPVAIYLNLESGWLSRWVCGATVKDEAEVCVVKLNGSGFDSDIMGCLEVGVHIILSTFVRVFGCFTIFLLECFRVDR